LWEIKMAIARKKWLIIRILLWSSLLLLLYSQLVRLGLIPAPFMADEPLCLEDCSARPTFHKQLPPQQQANQFLNSEQSLQQLLGNSIDKTKTSILIEKANYRLTLYFDQKPIKSYPVVFGNPQGDKFREGDKRTPQGILRIRDLYPHPSWSKFLWLDYPNQNSWRKHWQAKRSGKLPWTAAIGGEVGIHGVPSSSDAWVEQRQNWTLGCPSLKNKDVDELYEVVQIGTVVEIVP
jgi:murein L,D-transpeptidase YafK